MTKNTDKGSFDPEVAIEETPGYLGHIFDGYVSFGPELRLLGEFDWENYCNIASELDVFERTLNLDLAGDSLTFKADPSCVNEFLDKLPSIEAIYDCPKDQGPASGSGYVFVLKDNWRSNISLEEQVNSLREALELDYEKIQFEYSKK